MFAEFKKKVQEAFASISNHDMFEVEMEKGELFDLYLSKLPDDYRQEATCRSCNNFFNHYGNVVAIIDGKLKTIWDFESEWESSEAEATYEKAIKAIRKLVKSRKIVRPFVTEIAALGTDFNRATDAVGKVIRWEHLYFKLPSNRVYRGGDKSVAGRVGDLLATKHVFQRGLETITSDALDTVIDLIASKSIYRGQEFEQAVLRMRDHKKAYDSLKTAEKKSLYVWSNYVDGGRIRNSAIGTLLIDLSEGVPLEDAVRSFEVVVAPANYRRSTAVVTEKMVSEAQKKIEALGLSSALKRRHANADDIPLDHLLFVNRSRSDESIFDSVKSEAPAGLKPNAKVKEVSLNDFVETILPTAKNVEVLVENTHNFVSLFAPEDPDAQNMFAWNNPISWTYQNNLTDVIKEKVKAAGGNVGAELRVSLEWFNFDDLDLHLIDPLGEEIYFGNKRSRSGGVLDVDMNAGRAATREPVENIVYTDKSTMREGQYIVTVHNYYKRENENFGFNIQIECRGDTFNLSRKSAVQDNRRVKVATFEYSRTEGVHNLHTDLEIDRAQKDVNGTKSGTFVRSSMIMFSPNHWENNIGNKHLFFILEGARITTPLRPFFNEYLSPALKDHRKVFEVLAGKLMAAPSSEQLTGIGLSLTQDHQLIVKVNNKVMKVII